MTPEQAIEILAYIASEDLCGTIWWRCDGKFAPITIFVNCNDLFFWAAADTEPITPETLPILKQAIEDAKKIDDVDGSFVGLELYCCRIREIRPQRPAYPKNDKFHALFDSCGPERSRKDEG